MIEIIIGVVLFIIIILAFFSVINNKFKLAIIKFEKAEEEIDIYLEKKHDLINRAKEIINKEIKKEDFFVELDDNYQNLNHFEKNELLKKLYNEFFKVIDDHDKLLKSDNLVLILEELNINEENMVGSIKFYNDTVVDFNQLILSFPSSIIAFIKRYKKKEFYSNEKREIEDILNTK